MATGARHNRSKARGRPADSDLIADLYPMDDRFDLGLPKHRVIGTKSLARGGDKMRSQLGRCAVRSVRCR
jgi:hypothetical protein